MSAQSAIYNPSQTTSAATGDGFSTPRLTTAGRLAISFTTKDAGMMVYDTDLNNLFIWTGAAWESVPASGDAGANGAVQYNDNGVVSGAANFFWDKTNNRVGINTASPTDTLDVNGRVTALRYLSSSSNAALPSFAVSAGNGVYNSGTNEIGFSINSTTAMTLNSAGLGVGIVPSLGNGKFQVLGGVNYDGQFNLTAQFVDVITSASKGVLLGYNNTTNNGIISAAYGNGTEGLTFWTHNGSSWGQRMELTATGNLLVGTTSAISSGSTFQNLGTARQVLTLKGDSYGSYTFGVWNASTTNDAEFQYFGTETSLTVRGSISYNRAGGLVAYNTTSDYRAKDIIGPVSNSGSIIDSLKVYVGKMKGATIERPMLIAHEAQEVAPYAVTGTKDEVDADGKPKYQQMDASALVPLLIAEIQSLRARVQTLETR